MGIYHDHIDIRVQISDLHAAAAAKVDDCTQLQSYIQFLFTEHGIEPTDCFTMLSAAHLALMRQLNAPLYMLVKDPAYLRTYAQRSWLRFDQVPVPAGIADDPSAVADWRSLVERRMHQNVFLHQTALRIHTLLVLEPQLTLENTLVEIEDLHAKVCQTHRELREELQLLNLSLGTDAGEQHCDCGRLITSAHGHCNLCLREDGICPSCGEGLGALTVNLCHACI